jgi:hypothetical protein
LHHSVAFYYEWLGSPAKRGNSSIHRNRIDGLTPRQLGGIGKIPWLAWLATNCVFGFCANYVELAGKPWGEVLRTPGVRSTSPQGLLYNPIADHGQRHPVGAGALGTGTAVPGDGE